MKLEKYILKNFADKQQGGIPINIVIPLIAQFIKAVVLPDGIFLYYLVGEIESADTRVDTYMIMQGGQSLPDKAVIVDVLDTFFEDGENTGVIIYPIIQLKN